MPVTQWTVPDSSPWISYTGFWGDSDTDTSAYVNNTFHFTNASNAAATIVFNGTGASLYGAFRSNHDTYLVDFDNNVTTHQGYAPDPGVFNQSLFSVSKVPLGQHSIALVNPVTGKYTDIDYAIIEVGDGNPNTSSYDFWMDDTHPNVTYDSNWSVGTGNLVADYYNSSFHVTSSSGSSALIRFSGHQIALYGAASTNHGGYSVSLDGMPPQSYNGSEITFRAQQLLYFASNLQNGSHTILLTNTQAESSTDFDYAIATTYWTVGPTTTTSGNSPSSSNQSTNSSTPVAAIAGGVVGGVVMLGVIALLLFLIHRQRKKNRGDAIFSQKGQDALGHELAPGISVAAMASYGGMRGPSPPRSYANGLGANPNANHSASMLSGTTASVIPGMGGHQYAERVQQPYGTAASATAGDPLLGRGNEVDMPPPNYDHVFSQAPSSGGGSQIGGSQFGGSSAGGSLPLPPEPQNTQVYRQLREKGVVIPPEAQVRVTRAPDL